MNKGKSRESREIIAAEYARLAETYDAKWSFYVDATTRETLRRLRLRPHDQVLDVGCGTGALLAKLSLVHPASRISGIDPVPEMLAIARHRLPTPVRLSNAWAEDLPFAAGQFDVVISCNMFHYLRQPVLALQEIQRVLRPGGRLLITDWCHDFVSCRLCGLYLRRLKHAPITLYRTRQCRQLLETCGYRVEDIDRYKISWLWGLMTAQARTWE